MPDVLIDTCVVLDVADPDSSWYDWSVATLEALDGHATLLIDPVIHAECAVGYDSIEAFDGLLDTLGFGYREIPKEALFLAGNAFLRYRHRQGTKSGVLPDFFIGAHASVEGFRLMTRDVSRFRSYFPTIELIVPEG